MSGQCLCSWCVEARQRARSAETADLRGLAAYDQARAWDAHFGEQFDRDAVRREAALVARRVELAAWRARNMRMARERAGASCP